MEDFPGNSQRARQAPRDNDPEPKIAESKKLDKVVEGEVVRRKKPYGRRLRESFLGGDGQTVREYLLEDVILPNFRDLILDVINSGSERLILGESRAAHRRGATRFGNPTGRINYNGFSQQPVGRGVQDDSRASLSRRARASHDFEEIIIATRSEAQMVLDSLFDALERYDSVAVADLYELVGISANYAELRYGWTDLRGSRIERTRHGYLLNLPKPGLLER